MSAEKCPYCIDSIADAIGPSGSDYFKCRTCSRTFDLNDCPNHWHCDPQNAPHKCDKPVRHEPCPTCGERPAIVDGPCPACGINTCRHQLPNAAGYDVVGHFIPPGGLEPTGELDGDLVVYGSRKFDPASGGT